jgi:hypothetical protein
VVLLLPAKIRGRFGHIRFKEALFRVARRVSYLRDGSTGFARLICSRIFHARRRPPIREQAMPSRSYFSAAAVAKASGPDQAPLNRAIRVGTGGCE